MLADRDAAQLSLAAGGLMRYASGASIGRPKVDGTPNAQTVACREDGGVGQSGADSHAEWHQLDGLPARHLSEIPVQSGWRSASSR
jgi:hypothetical protein